MLMFAAVSFDSSNSPGNPKNIPIRARWAQREAILRSVSALREILREGTDGLLSDGGRLEIHPSSDLQRVCELIPSRSLVVAAGSILKAAAVAAAPIEKGRAASMRASQPSRDEREKVRQRFESALGRFEQLVELALLGAPQEQQDALVREISGLCEGLRPPSAPRATAAPPSQQPDPPPRVARARPNPHGGPAVAPVGPFGDGGRPTHTGSPPTSVSGNAALFRQCADLIDQMEKSPHDRTVLERLAVTLNHISNSADTVAAAEARSGVELLSSVLSGEALLDMTDLVAFLRLCLEHMQKPTSERDEKSDGTLFDAARPNGGHTPAVEPPSDPAPEPPAMAGVNSDETPLDAGRPDPRNTSATEPPSASRPEPPAIVRNGTAGPVAMVLVDGIYRRILRPVRTEASRLGKLLDLRFKGGDARIPRQIAETLHSVIAELAHNAVQHGLESPQGRARSGKYPRGLVEVETALEPGAIRVEITDDGAGIDPARLRIEAVADGISVDDDTSLPECLLAVARARGSGLARVADLLVASGGTLQIETEPGAGSVFRVWLPLSYNPVRSRV